MILGLSSSLKYKNAKDWAEKHKSLGCKAVVFPLNSNSPKAEIMEFKNQAEKNGLVIAEVGVWKNTLSNNPKEKEENITYAINQLKMADEIEAVCCVNIIGTAHGELWDGGYKQNFSSQTWNSAINMIQEIIDKAEPKKTMYSIETMPWMYPTSADEYLKMITDVNRKNFGVHLDLVNMINCPRRYFFNEDFAEECFTKLKGKILSCHLKDVKLLREYTFQLKECACGKGDLNLEKYAELATKENCNMPMIIEHLNTDKEYLQSLEYVKKRLKEYIKN